MKRITHVLLMGLAVLLIAGESHAAGSWAAVSNDEGYLDAQLGSTVSFVREATSDAADATVPTWPAVGDSDMNNFSGCITGYQIVFDGTVPPTSVVANFKTKYGLTINPLTYTTVNTGDVRVEFDRPTCVAGGLYAAFTVVGNSKKFKVVVDVLR